MVVCTYGIPADAISQISGQPIPGNFYYEMALRAERITKAPETLLYNTVHLSETLNLYYANHKQSTFTANIIAIFANVQQENRLNMVILDQSAFYPFSGGQENDLGWLTIEGVRYTVSNVQKIGKCVVHITEVALPSQDLVGKACTGEIDVDRRAILRCHHTATHIVFAACRRVLGPHVWQNGAHKSIHNAHLDITHYSSLTRDQEQQIENEVNKIILSAKPISKSFMDKAEAEKEYGFRLY